MRRAIAPLFALIACLPLKSLAEEEPYFEINLNEYNQHEQLLHERINQELNQEKQFANYEKKHMLKDIKLHDKPPFHNKYLPETENVHGITMFHSIDDKTKLKFSFSRAEEMHIGEEKEDPAHTAHCGIVLKFP